MVTTWVLEFALLLAVITLPATLGRMRAFTPPPHPKYEVIYFSGDYLPQTTDMGGAQAGHSGRSGGRSALDRVQVIKVSRGDSLAPTVVDAPKLKLPLTNEAVANLIAIAATKPGPPPTAGLASLKPKLLLPADAVAPQPSVTRDKLHALQTTDVAAVPPAPEVARNKLLKALELNAAAGQPAPSVTRGEIVLGKLPQTSVPVVPPPVSAPIQDSELNAKLTLPPATAVQPPPDTTLSRELWNIAGSLFGGGKKDVVIPPPVQPSGGDLSGQSKTGLSAPLGGGTEVVPPPPDSAGGALRGTGTNGGGGGTLAALGTPPVAGPSGSGGNSASSGVVLSTQPGSKFGAPGNAGAGSLAIAPSGFGRAGLGGEGNGAGTGRGVGPGSGTTGEGSGSAETGTGFGANLNAKGGIANGPGRGGAGKGGGSTSMAGVSIRGGVVSLPSFGTGANAPNIPGHTASQPGVNRAALTVIATPRSGGAVNLYGALKGEKVYTIYIDTGQGPAILQFADPSSANSGFDEDLTAPEAMLSELPPAIKSKKPRLLVSCTMDRSGLLRNLKVLQGPAADVSDRMLAALTRWRFRPVLRGNDPIEVEAILGFNIDTHE